MLLNLIDKFFIKKPKFRRAVTALLYRDRDLDVNLCGTDLHINARRENGYLRASKTTSWNGTLRDEMPVLVNLMALFQDGDTFVDVGANVGLYTHTFARLRNLYPAFTIDAFEPHPSTFARLSFRDIPGVTFHNFGIGERNETLEFVDGAVSHVFTRNDKANSYNISSEKMQVEIKRLDDVSIGSGSLIIKIDVEGQEASVIAGAQQLFEANRIKAVYLDGYDDVGIHEVLTKYGFELHCGRTFQPVTDMVFSLLAIHRGFLPTAAS
ncbi:MAG: FkbM family methyltransferase [Planctomycetaceae bacterium]